MTRDTQQPLADVSDADDTMTTVVPARSNIRWDSFGSSNVGKIRSINEDAYLDAGDRALWLVADGMGGHSAGDVASGAIAEAFDLLTPPVGLSDFVDLAESTLIALNEKFLEMANFGRDGATIGSTVVVLAERQGWMIYLWAGDSRLYRWRRGELHQLTQDHSQVEDLVSQGILLRENAESHPAANIVTRAVGAAKRLCIDMDYCDVEPGDRFLLCSDGLTKEVSDQAIAECLARDLDARGLCEQLIETTLAGRARDNVTVLVTAAPAAVEST